MGILEVHSHFLLTNNAYKVYDTYSNNKNYLDLELIRLYMMGITSKNGL